MLPFRVIQLEQHRALQQNAANPYLQGSSPLPEFPSERNFATRSRRFSGPFWPKDFATLRTRNMPRPTQKKESILAKWAPTSNRQLPANRSYRKQTTKPCLTGARTHIREFQKSPKIDPIFALFFAPISDARSGGIA
jgi:hypothetical protein